MKKKKSLFRRILPWAGLAALAVLLALLPRLARSAETGEKAALLTAAATVGDVENTLGGGGTLTAEEPVDVEIPSAVEIQEFLVDNGDHVEAGQPVAKVDRVTLLSALSDAQESINILTEKMQVALRDTEYSWIQSQAVGRVKAVYASMGDDAAQVVLNHGALAVVSIDGLMVTKVRTELPIKAGEKLTVRLSDGQELPARVESELDGVISVILSDKEPAIGESVTVLTGDGNVVGVGFLDVHSPWNVIATQGTVANVVVTENQVVYAGTRMICLSFENGNEEYRSLVTKRRQYEDLMAELFALYTDDTITAPEAGFVSGIDKSIIKNTAALDRKPALKLLAGGLSEAVESMIGVQETHSILFVGEPILNPLLKAKTVLGIKVDGNLERDKMLQIYYQYLANTLPEDSVVIVQLPNEPESYTPEDYMEKDSKQFDLVTTVGKIPQTPGIYKPLQIIYGKMNFGKLIEESFAGQTDTEIDYSDLDLGSFVMDVGGAGEQKNEEAALLQKTTVLSVIPDTSMTVTMDVDELDIAYYEPGQKADILVDALPNQSFSAVVEEVSAIGKNSGGNSKYTVKLRLDRAPDMLNGMNASVVVHRGVKTGLLLPVAAVYDRGSQCFVYTAVDNKTGKPIIELPVVTGVSDGEVVEIVDGLTEGQVVFYEYYLPVEEGN